MPNDIQKLIDEFSKASKIHCDTLTSGDWKTANRQAKIIHETYLRIKVIGSTARDALLNLAKNYDDSIACMAAVYSLTHDEKNQKKLFKESRESQARSD